MKIIVLILLCLLLILSGCDSQQRLWEGENSSGVEQSPDEIAEIDSVQRQNDVASMDSKEKQDEPDTVLQEAQRNIAVNKIDGLPQMPEEAAGAVQSYGSQMGWMEANQITNLERYTPISNAEYFLIVPQYVNSNITVESLNWEGTGAPTVRATTYHKENTSDDYALVLDTIAPESAPSLRVTISCGDLTGIYYFAYDGKGEQLTRMSEGMYLTYYKGFTKPDISSSGAATAPTPTDRPGFQSGAGTNDRSGVFFVEHNPSSPDKALRVDYVVKLPYEWTKEFKYPDSEYAQYFFTGEYLVRFEGYYWNNSPLTEYLSYPDAAETVTLGTKTVYVERLQSGDSIFNEYFFALEDGGYYVKAVLYPYLHSLENPTLTYTQTLNELDEEVRLMIASFSVSKQTVTQRPF